MAKADADRDRMAAQSSHHDQAEAVTGYRFPSTTGASAKTGGEGVVSRGRQFEPEARPNPPVGRAIRQPAADRLGPLLRQGQAQPGTAGGGGPS